MTTIFKGFIVPSGYVLTINTPESNELLTKYPGEYSGSRFTLEEVISGQVPHWSLEEITVQPPSNKELQSIITSINLAGGTPLFVGGIVRDTYLGKENKDIDIEVYGLSFKELEDVLSYFGRVDTVGATFGVVKLTTPRGDYDFSLPRRENKVGVGHKEFSIEPDPSMTPKEAAERRDFTINALAMTHDGNLMDFFGGVADLKAGVLRHTSRRFAEDPLRVLRGFQFAARFNMRMAEDTARLSASLRGEYESLSVERVWGEWEKWATKSVVPSAGIQVLEETGWLELYPELHALRGVKQEPEWHPEGDVLAHTKHVIDAASEIATRENLNESERLVLMFAALCHDLGKPNTTVFERDRWRAPGHAQEGEAPTISFLTSIGAPLWLIKQVVPLVKEHMAHVSVTEMTDRVVRRISTRVAPSNIEMLAYVIEADHSGRPPLPKEMPEQAREMLKISERLNVTLGQPKRLVGGNDLYRLAEAGQLPEEYLRPGKHFGVLLNYLYDAQLEGRFFTTEEADAFITETFNLGEQKRIQENIDFLLELSYTRVRLLVAAAETRGITEDELFRKPLEELKRMANLLPEEDGIINEYDD